VEWKSRDDYTLYAHGSAAVVSVNGVHMSAVKSEGYDGDEFSCVYAERGATLSLEGCDLTCEGGAPVAQFAFKETTGVLFGCCIHVGKRGVFVCDGASATLENNTITGNDLSGVIIGNHSTANLTGNTIKGNGQCKIEWTEEELATWSEAMVALYRSPDGFPGVRVVNHSTVTMMPPGSNTIEGNRKVGSSGEQVTVDETSSAV
jgi:parallel beta-helix repeat protein